MAEKKPARRSSARKTDDTKKKQDVANPEERIAELQEEQFKLRFQFATRQLTNTARFRQVRRDIARMKTLQRQRELAARRDAAAASA